MLPRQISHTYSLFFNTMVSTRIEKEALRHTLNFNQIIDAHPVEYGLGEAEDHGQCEADITCLHAAEVDEIDRDRCRKQSA